MALRIRGKWTVSLTEYLTAFHLTSKGGKGETSVARLYPNAYHQPRKHPHLNLNLNLHQSIIPRKLGQRSQPGARKLETSDPEGKHQGSHLPTHTSPQWSLG